MEKINELLGKLDNKVNASMAKRIDGLNQLYVRMEKAKAEHTANPTEESQSSLDEIESFIDDSTDDIVERLEIILEAKEIAKASALAEQDGKVKGNVVTSVVTPNADDKDKKSYGWLGFVAGAVLLVVSVGAINILNKK